MTTAEKTAAKLEAIRQKIEELVPDAGFWQKGKPLDFTLEDVLQAIDAAAPSDCITIGGDGWFVFPPRRNLTADRWLFGKPLSEQSTEMIDFLHSLLCP
jgi:hypothetical protein